MAARRSSNSAASTGNRPQNTTGWVGRKPGSGTACRLAVVRDGVADPCVGHLLDRGVDEADLARAEILGLLDLGGERRRPAPRHRPALVRIMRMRGSACAACRRPPAPAPPRRDRCRTSCRPGAPSRAHPGRPWSRQTTGRWPRGPPARSARSWPKIRMTLEASIPITSSICCLTLSVLLAGRSTLLSTGTISCPLSIA